MCLEIKNILKDHVQQEREKGAEGLLKVFNIGSELPLTTTEMAQTGGISKDPQVHHLLKDTPHPRP